MLFVDVSKKELTIEIFWSKLFSVSRPYVSMLSGPSYIWEVILVCENFLCGDNGKDKLRSKIDVKHQLIYAVSKIDPLIKIDREKGK